MEAVAAALAHAKLDRYCDRFEADGYDNVDQLHAMSENELREIAREMGMPPGHVARLVGQFGSQSAATQPPEG